MPITPPPMMITLKRSSHPDTTSSSNWVNSRAGQPGRRRFETFHGPGPEVELDRAAGLLDSPPQGPAVLAHQAEELGPGDLVTQRPSVVMPDQFGQAVRGQLAFGGDVAQLEARVVVAGVLVVDQPDALAVVDEVSRQQVVVARHGALAAHGQGALGGLHLGRERGVAIGDLETVLRGHGQVAALHPEHVEVAGEPRPGVQQPAGPGDPGQHGRVGHVGVAQRPAVQVAEHQHAARRAGRPAPARRPRRPRPPPSCDARGPGRWPAGRRAPTPGPRSSRPGWSPGSSGWSNRQAAALSSGACRPGRAPGRTVWTARPDQSSVAEYWSRPERV